MNVLVICNFSSGLLKFRGLLIETLIKQKNEVSAVVPQSDDKDELMAENDLEKIGCKLIHVSMERRGMNPLKDFKLLLDYIKVIRKYKPDFAITYTIKPNAYGSIACQICGVPYAVNVTGLGTAFQGDGMLRKFVTALYKVAFRKAKVVFFENEGNREVIVNAGIISKERTHVLHGAGVDLEKFPHLEYPQDNDCTQFLFIGRVMREKGVGELFAAMRMLYKDGVNCHLNILGGFDEDYSERIKECETEGWLTYHGYQSDVRPFIANCHCFVLPSWHEGMANTNLECAASGRPVITSNIHGCMEAVEDGVSGYLCERRNVDDLHRAMKGFVELSIEQRNAMGLAGRKRMEELFDKRKVVKETISYL